MAELKQLPDVVDLSFIAGDTFRIRIRVIDPNSPDGVALPLADYTFAADIAKESDRAIVTSFDVVPDVDDPEHSIILTLPPAETDVLPGLGTGSEFRGLWDLEVGFPNGDVRTVAKGAVTCYIDVTNSGSP